MKVALILDKIASYQLTLYGALENLCQSGSISNTQGLRDESQIILQQIC